MDFEAASVAARRGCVQVISDTWVRDSHDLFDFEARQLLTKSFMVPRSAKFVRIGTDVQVIGEHAAPPPECEQVLRVVRKDGAFWVDRASQTASASKRLWLVVRDMEGAGYRLSEGDTIKLGRFKFRVRQMATSPDSTAQPELRLDDNCGVCTTDLSGDERERLKNTSCRICLLEGSSEEDPLIRPCQCKGSIEYVHLGCLRHWIKGRLNLLDNQGGSYLYRPLPCELCKAPYPAYIQAQGHEREPLVEVPRTSPPFIVLENMVKDSHSHQTTSRGLHVVSLAESKLLRLGRGHESDVRIADVSISRCHATIRFHQGGFILEDHNSKFGTLVAMKKPRVLDPGSAISIQAGRTVLSLRLQQQDGTAPPQAATGPARFLAPTGYVMQAHATDDMLMVAADAADAEGPAPVDVDQQRGLGSR